MIYMITPAHGRPEISEVVFQQRADLPIRQVVIACDENLEIARALGFDTIERSNDYLGRRFNDGFEHAYKQGAEWIGLAGSDDWIHPDFLENLKRYEARATRQGAVVRTDGLALNLTYIPYEGGVGTRVYHRSYFDKAQRLVVPEERNKGIDGSIFRHLRGLGLRPDWSYYGKHLGVVGFKSATNITPYNRVVHLYSYLELDDPWGALSQHYPDHHVEAMKRAYGLVGTRKE